MKSRMGGLRRQFMSNHLMTTNIYSSNRKNNQEKEENIIHWTTFF